MMIGNTVRFYFSVVYFFGNMHVWGLWTVAPTPPIATLVSEVAVLYELVTQVAGTFKRLVDLMAGIRASCYVRSEAMIPEDIIR